jgi:hypothetical protein
MFLVSDARSFKELLCIPPKSRAFSNIQSLCLPVTFRQKLYFPLWGEENALPLPTLKEAIFITPESPSQRFYFVS